MKKVPSYITEITKDPVFKIRNIHPELTVEDLSSLFEQIAPVQFIKFDEGKKSVAYGCFETDFQENNAKAIESFNGKKAMGKILIVEDPFAPKPSLKDRLGPLPGAKGRNNGRNQRFNDRIRPRGRNDGRGGKRDSYRPSRPKKVAKSVEDLDKELTEYMNST